MKNLFITITVILAIILSSVCFNQARAAETNDKNRNYGQELYWLLNNKSLNKIEIRNNDYVQWNNFRTAGIYYDQKQDILQINIHRYDHADHITSKIKIFDFTTSSYVGRFATYPAFRLSDNDYILIGDEKIFVHELNEKNRENLEKLYNNILSVVVEKLKKEIFDSKERKNNKVNNFINAE